MKQTTGIWKKVAIMTLLGFGLSLGATSYAEGNLETIYHVYMGDKHVGVVDEKEVVQTYIDQRLDQAQEDRNHLQVTTERDIVYVPEKMFTPSHDNEEVMNVIKNDITIVADAVALTVGDRTVAYLPSEDKAQKAIQQYKAQYVDEEVLRNLKERKENGEEPNIDDSTIIDVKLTNEVSKKEEKVKPGEVVTVEEAVNILQKGTPEETLHTVEEGEVLSEISSKYDLSKEKLYELNPELSKGEPLQIGQELNVTELEPLTKVLVTEEGIKEETISYETKVVETDDLRKGETEVKQEGQEGKKEVHYSLKEKNGNVIKEKTLDEEVITEPVKEIILKGTKVTPSQGTGEFEWPAVGGTITSEQGSRWGDFHKGIDISGVSDHTIKSADNGVVVSAGSDGDYGNKVVINHNNGYKTIYAHLASISVSPGETVEKGSAIGVMGTTGDSTGVHLHFEVYKDGSLQNPLSYF
ncbi:peptidoglycan DD-metalloendopeptidase family protein [Halobacillus ihumii]|uniref:peptidoglycan DD-metalloendopeptidase family protein n=1 Tax=Halobacillus ihumii TaxID=2686092 RepID=UPI0013D8920C|nr:M23 family metallopeptidase [Halobacillus ihumii]